jgi:integrase
MAKRDFGTVRQLKSGSWQARYRGPDGLLRPAPHTFERKRDAQLFLSKVEADMARDDWYDPSAGQMTVMEFGRSWLAERRLADTTRERYEVAFRVQVLPTFGNLAVNKVREADVRRWRAELLDGGTGEASVAKAYRLLRAIMSTAVDDGLIRRNPCRIKGAGDDRSPERPVLAVGQVLQVAEVMPARFRMLVLLATFTSLRFGELAALRRMDVDAEAGFLRVHQSQAELSNGQLIVKGPKTAAGRRRVAVPGALLADLRSHLAKFSETGPDGLVFVGEKGGRLRRQNFRAVWVKALSDAAVPAVHFHDLRHTGNTLAAAQGATLRELMERMGHASSRAAMIYQHISKDRDRHIADGLSAQIESAREDQVDDEVQG